MSGNLRTLFRQFSQYSLVGGLAFSIDFSALFVLTKYGGLHYLLSATAGFLLGLIANYLLCIKWIFDHRALKNTGHEFAIFLAIGIAGLILNNLIIFGLTEWVEIYYLHSKLFSAALILVFNFWFRKTLLFTKRKSKTP